MVLQQISKRGTADVEIVTMTILFFVDIVGHENPYRYREF
jgi:hypothetical protein